MSFKLKKYGFTSERHFKDVILSFVKHGISQKDMATSIGCSRHTIIKACKHFDIEITRQDLLHIKCGFKTDDELAVEFKNLYSNGFSQKDIAKHFGVSVLSVSKCFTRHKIEIRTNSESMAIRQKDVKQLSDKERSIIYGLLMGNGDLKRKVYTASLFYSCSHSEVIETLMKELSRLEPTFRFRRSRDRGWYQFRTLSYMCLAQIYDNWYVDDSKTLPSGFDLSNESCYWWYAGDGSSNFESLKILANISNPDDLIEKMPVSATWHTVQEKFPFICIRKPEDREKFLEFLGPCRQESYAYKWKVYTK